MTIALPARFADLMTSVASAGKEAADNLLHEASHVAEHAAGASSAKGRDLFSSTDEVEARVEEAVGALTDNDDVKANGKHDDEARLRQAGDRQGRRQAQRGH